MPPDPSVFGHTNAEDGPALSDENVAILYEIVQFAEQQRNCESQPFRALFTAYDEILPRHGLHTAQDQTYLRFVFRLGDGKQQNQSLFERFERLLDELGIQIEFDAEDETTHSLARWSVAEDDNVHKGHGSQRRRRASFDPAYKVAEELQYDTNYWSESPTTQSRFDVPGDYLVHARPSTRATSRPTEKHFNGREHNSRNKHTRAPVERLSAKEFSRSLQQQQHEYNPRPPSPSSIGATSTNVLTDATRQDEMVSDTSTTTEHGGHIAPIMEHQRVIHTTHPKDMKQRTSYAQKQFVLTSSKIEDLREAEAFRLHVTRKRAKEWIYVWCCASIRARQGRQSLENLALEHDRKTLLHQIFDHWRAEADAKVRAKSALAQLNAIENRFTLDRNAGLVLKAFTHWTQLIHERQNRAIEVREHALATKYFGIWQDVTDVGKPSLYRVVSVKAFQRWAQYHAQNKALDVQAKEFRIHQLQAFCILKCRSHSAIRIADKFLVRNLKSNALRIFRTKFETQKSNRQEAIDLFQRHFHLSFLKTWLSVWRSQVTMLQQAKRFREVRLQLSVIHKGSQRCIEKENLQHFSNTVDWRIAQWSCGLLVNKARLRMQADRVDDRRLLKTALAQIMQHVRCRSVTEQIDERVSSDALYQWMIASRFACLCRIEGRRRMLECLQLWRIRFHRLEDRRSMCLEKVSTQHERLVTSSIFSWWRARNSAHDESMHSMRATIKQHLKHAIVQTWKQKLEHLQTLELWGRDARWFFLTQETLRSWKQATIEKKRKKRLVAYRQMLISSKATLIREVLRTWQGAHTRTKQLRLMVQDQQVINEKRTTMLYLELWSNRHWNNQGQLIDADLHYEEALRLRALKGWMTHHGRIQKLQSLAEDTAWTHTQEVSYALIRKLKLKMIELKGQQGKAENLKSSHDERRRNDILRQIREAIATRRNLTQEPKQLSTRPGRTRRFDLSVNRQSFGNSPRSEYEISTGRQMDVVGMTQAPELLDSPSNRPARAKPMLLSTTPAGTPFRDRLRAQLNITPRTQIRPPFGRTSALKFNAARSEDESLGSASDPVRGYDDDNDE